MSATIRDQLFVRRVKLGLTQTDVAKRMGTSQSALSDMESGRSDPRLATLSRWAEALGYQVALDRTGRIPEGAA